MPRQLSWPKPRQRPSHHANSNGTSFKNPWPSASTPTWAELLQRSFPLGWYSADPLPEHIRPVRVVKPDWGAATRQSHQGEESAGYVVATWLGHAGAMVEFPSSANDKVGDLDDGSTHILFDPIFSYRAGPTQYTGPSRIMKCPFQVSELPGCNFVCISHNHYDHLDLATVQDINRFFPTTKWFVPLGNKAWFRGSGIAEDNVVELDWWQSWESSSPNDEDAGANLETSAFKLTCVPAQHNSGRWGFDGGSTLWCGWVVERFSKDSNGPGKRTRTASIYHAGDTGYRRIDSSEDVCPAFKEIGEKFGGFDLSFIPIWRGGTLGFVSYAGVRLLHKHMPSAFHCSPEDAFHIHEDVKSRNTIAVHFGTFVGSERESEEAVLEFYEACKNAGVEEFDSDKPCEKGRAGTLDIGGSRLFHLEI